MYNTQFKKAILNKNREIEVIKKDGSSIAFTDTETAINDLKCFFGATEEEISALLINEEEINFY